MKFYEGYEFNVTAKSHPVRGAWIEICSVSISIRLAFASHPVRGAWIEIKGEIIYLTKEDGRIP